MKIQRIKRSDILKTAIDIFGDIVVGVYEELEVYPGDVQTSGADICGDEIEFVTTVIIEFTNGKFVKFGTAKYSWIEPSTKKEVVECPIN